MEDGILPLWASFSQLLAWLITSSGVSGIKLCPSEHTYATENSYINKNNKIERDVSY